jgi:uncharacterized membrane protein
VWLVVHAVRTFTDADVSFDGPVGGVEFQRAMRRMILWHALLSFVFGAVILANTVNLVASLLNR